MVEPRVSADPQKQHDYEVFCKGWDNGVEAERERIVKKIVSLCDAAENAETRRLLIEAMAFINGENK